jgi:hypothetical protein
MNRASTLAALAIALAIQAAAGAPRLASAGAPATATARASLPAALDRALERRDPVALADTTLPRLAALDATDRERLAARLESWDTGARVAAYAFLQVGTPYRLGPLGEEAPPDTDPVIEFETTDCAVLNLVSAALAHVRDAGGERAAMAIANYRGGRIGYATRFHFTTDRLDSCAYYRDITRQVAGPACQRRVVALNRRADGSRWIPIDWSRTREVVYVPRSLGAQFEHWYAQRRIPAAMGVAFVEVGKLADGLDVVHESLLWKGRVFLHASSRTGRVVTLPWPEFLAGPGRRYDGFVLFEYR